MGQGVLVRRYPGSGHNGRVGYLEKDDRGEWSVVVMPCSERDLIEAALRGVFEAHAMSVVVERCGRVVFRLLSQPSVRLRNSVLGIFEGILSARLSPSVWAGPAYFPR